MKKTFVSIWLAMVLLTTNALPVLASEVAPESEEASVAESVGFAYDGRPLYSVDHPPDFPVFNSVVDGELGDEQNFLSIALVGAGMNEPKNGSVDLIVDQTYEARILYCNDGVAQGIKSSAYANDARVSVLLPSSVYGSEQIVASISAMNSQPKTANAAVYLQSTEPLTIEYVNGSARIESDDETNGSIISTEDLFGDGAFIGTHSMTGIVLNGPENSGYLVFQFRTVPATTDSAVAAASPNMEEPSESELVTLTNDDDQLKTTSQPTSVAKKPLKKGFLAMAIPVALATIAVCTIVLLLVVLIIKKSKKRE